MVPKPIGAANLLVNETTWWLPGRDFTPPPDRQASDSKAVIDRDSYGQVDRTRRENFEPQPGWRQDFEIVSVREKSKDLFERPWQPD